MKRCVKDLFTDVDNETYALGAVLWAVAVAAYIGLSVYDVVVAHHEFNMLNFGVGFASVLLAGGYAHAKTMGPTQEKEDVQTTSGAGNR